MKLVCNANNQSVAFHRLLILSAFIQSARVLLERGTCGGLTLTRNPIQTCEPTDALIVSGELIHFPLPLLISCKHAG